jgi:hypothetical protein
MTEHDDRVEQLVRNAPPIQRSVWQRLGRLVAAVAMVCSFVGLGIGAYAGLKAQQIAHCTNANIDARGQVQIRRRRRRGCSRGRSTCGCRPCTRR